MQGILGASSTRKLALSSTAVVALSLAFVPAALADCLPSASGLTVTCTTADPDGYNGSAVDGLTINVTNGATVGGATAGPLLQAGASSALNNEGSIVVTSGDAVTLGGGSTFTDAVTATGIITGNITLGQTGDGQVNTFNNFNSTNGIVGDVTSNGTTNFTNDGTLTGNVAIVGPGTDTISNTGTLTGNLTADGDTSLDNSGTITGDVTLGAGNDIVNNTGTITGNINLGAGDNTFGASGTAQLPTGSLTADPSGINTLNLFGSGVNTLNIPVTNFSVLNKYGTGSWALTQAVSLSQQINVSEGTLITPDADFLGANTIVNSAGPFGTGGVTFTNAADGTYSGNMSDTYNPADLSGAKGVVTIGGGGTSTTIFSGVNTYQGGTYITQGTLQVAGGAALADNGDVYIGGAGGILDVAMTETIGGLFDGTTANGQVTLSGGNLLINSGAFAGNISGANGIEKIGSGTTLTLSGTNTFAGPAVVTDGTLVLSGGNAIGDNTAVIVNSSDVTTGTLQVDTAETIGSLAGNGGNVVLNAGLTTGNDNTTTAYSGAISGAGSLTKIGTGTFSVWGANSYTGGTTVSAGTLEGNSTSLQGNITDSAGATLLFTQDSDGTYAGNITGAGTVTKAGAGNLTLTGTNTGHTGTTNLNGGIVSIGAATNIGVGTLAFDGGTLETTGALTLANAITLGAGGGTVQTDADTTLSGVISGAGHFTKSGGANLTLTTAPTYTGGTTIAGGTLTGTTTTIQGDIEDDAALVIDQNVAGTIASNITGSGSVALNGTGVITFTGINTYSGATLINAGTFVATGQSIGDTSGVTVATGANLNLTVDNETIGSLSGGGNVDLGTFDLITGGDGTASTFDGVLSNGGLIVAGPGSLTLTNAGNLLPGGLVVNAGGLDISSTGVVDTGASGTTVTGGTLTVDGTLTTADAQLTGGTTTVNGILNAATATVGGTLNVTALGAVNGPVTSTSGAVLNIDGTVTGDVANGAGATINGTGTIVGNLTNDGTLSPGHSPGIFNINGSLTQSASATLAVDLTPTATAGTGYDQVHVTGTPGTATLGGTLALHPTTGVLYTNGATYDVVLADNGITGNFATVTGNVISPFISFTSTGIVTTGGAQQAYRLTVARTSYAVGMGAGADPNEVAAANGFQGLIPGATGDAAALIINFDNSTAGEVQSFFHQATPEPYGAYATAIQDQGEMFTRQVSLRLHETATMPTGTSVWARGYGSWGNGDDKSYRYGSDQDIAGFAAGVDFTAGDLVLGGAAGWSKDNVDYNLGNSSGESKSWQIGGYGNYNVGAINADLQLSYIKGDFNASKSIVTSTINRLADADFGGHLFKAVGTVGYNTDMMDISIRPFVGIDYSNGNTDSFSETGADAANLTVASIDADKTDLMLGIDLTPTTGKLSPYGRAAFRYEVGDNDRNISAIYNGNAATAFTVSGVAPGRAEFDLDAGLSYAVTDAASIFAGYQGTIRNDLNHHGVSGGVRFSF